MSDRFYDYHGFDTERLWNIMSAWDGLGGYHGALIKKIASMIHPRESVLDVGCGLGHLYEAVKDKVRYYHGVDHDQRIVEWAMGRWYNDTKVKIEKGSVSDLSSYDTYSVVTAIGLYSGEPKNPQGLNEMLRCAEDRLILTFFKEKNRPDFLDKIDKDKYRKCHWVNHNIDDRLGIMVIKR